MEDKIKKITNVDDFIEKLIDISYLLDFNVRRLNSVKLTKKQIKILEDNGIIRKERIQQD